MSKIYNLLELIGKGAQGSVYIAENIKNNNKVVIKVIERTITNRKKIKREANIPKLLKCTHKNIVCVLDFFKDKKQAFIVYEYVKDSIDLTKYDIFSLKKIEIVDILYQLADGLLALHKNNIIHRDIKPHNVIMKNKTPIIIDFDLSCIVESIEEEFECKGAVGTPNYLSPELWLLRKGENIKIDYYDSDIYSLGVLFFYICNDKNLPFGRIHTKDLGYKVINEKPEPSDFGISDVDFMINMMLSKQPSYRPRLDSILKLLNTTFKNM